MDYLGSIGFETDRHSFISKAIRWITRSKWSHVFIVGPINSVSAKREILEADWQGVHIAFLDKYKAEHVKVQIYRVEVDPKIRNEAFSKCLDMIGKRYGFLQLLGFIPVVILGRLGIRIKNPITSGTVCSELALRYLTSLGISAKFTMLDKDATSPEDLFKLLEADNVRFQPVPAEVIDLK